MTPLETAMKLASASSTCEKHKCPFASQCKGHYDSCGMKEVALIIRSQNAEIDSLKSMCNAYASVLAATQKYIVDIEKINKRLRDICVAFEKGYRPKYKIKHKKSPRKIDPKKDPAIYDGDERYAQVLPPIREPDPPLVVI